MKIWKNNHGSFSIEALFVLPALLMLFFFIIEMGFVMYNWAVVNHAASAAAVEAAMMGRFSADIRQSTAEHIRDWTTDGKTMNIDSLGVLPPANFNPNTIYIYGTNVGTDIQRGNIIDVGVAYPFKFKTFAFDALGRWTTGESQVVLKANMKAASEVFFEL